MDISSSKAISYDLPKPGVAAGSVFQHSLRVVEKLFLNHSPLIFKVGFTHNPQWRFSNKLYGYVMDTAKWTHMIVLYKTHEPYSAAMLEAALIDKYKRS